MHFGEGGNIQFEREYVNWQRWSRHWSTDTTLHIVHGKRVAGGVRYLWAIAGARAGATILTDPW